MKTIKIIDLLNKIANGEEVPKRIRIDHWCYKFEWIEHESNYYDKHEDIDLMSCLSMDKEELNYEVHEIEEKKLPEKIYWDVSDDKYTTYINGKKCKACRDSLEELSDMYRQKINELLDYLESKEKGE